MQMPRRVTPLALLTLLAASLAPAQKLTENPNWFPKRQLMTIGVYYYPQAWPKTEWARDMHNIRKLGMEYVHMGEFSWYFEEPEEGQYDFDWLEKNVALAAKNGLKVILCTPSAAPPVWLVKEHPEVLVVDADGRRMQFGARANADWNSAVYRKYVAGIDTQLAKRFGHDPRIWGWQVDNELGHYSRGFSYSKATAERFREWLKQKYGTIDKLNQAWGGGFWSLMYQNFDQVEPPNPNTLVEGPSPHAMLDFERFWAWSAADYVKMQADVLRKYSKNQWITTNFMTMDGMVDPALSQGTLNAFTWTHYPVHGQRGQGPLGFRLGSGLVMNFMQDFLRPLSGISGLMELQPGQVNWGDINPWPLPGAIHMWIMQAFGAGADLVCTYRYRQALFGRELYHKGLVGTDGVTPSPGGRDYAAAMRDIVDLRKHYDPNAREPQSLAKRRTAFLIAYDNRWDIENHKQTSRWDTLTYWFKYYSALKSMMAPVDVLTPDRDFSKYPFVVAPAFQLVNKKLIQRWTDYVRNGGHLILTARTGQKNMEGHLWEAPWVEPIYNLVGARIPRYDDLPVGVNGTVTANGKNYSWGIWGAIIDPNDGTQVLATYADQFYKGKAAAVEHRLGKGTVTYIGVDANDGKLEHDLLYRLYKSVGAAPADLAPDFIVDWRDGFWVATNFTSKTQTIPAPADAELLLGKRQVPPGGFAVWQER